MKIIHLISGGDVGGAKTHVLSLLHGLTQTHTIQLVCFMEGEFAQEARELGIATKIIKSHNVLADCRRLADLIRTEGYQIIHCHGSRANMMGAMLRTMVSAPVVTTVHSDYRLDYLGRPVHRLTFGTINTIALRFLDYYIGVSESMAALLIQRGFDAQRMFSIYNGVDFTTPRHPLPRTQYLDAIGLKRERDSVIFGIAARISPVKDMGTLVRAFAKTVAEYPAARLVIAGDGEQAQELKALANSLCPADSVLFTGWISDVDSFYNAIDVNMLTSLSETFPYSLTEGARMHRATIASRVGGIPYLIDDGINGLLFPAQDVEALSRHMKLLAGDAALRERFGQRLYEKTKAQFSVEATVSRQEEIYRTILRRTARADRARDGVLICGAYGRRNAGDDAILQAIVGQLRSIDPDLPIYALSRHPRETALAYRIGACHTFHYAGYSRLLRHTKLYLSGGGTLLQNVTSGRSLLYYLSNISLAHRRGNHVMMYGCGIGPVHGKYSRRHSANVIRRCVDTVTLRDPDSAEELRRMGVARDDVHLTADPALLLSLPAPERVESLARSLGLDPDKRYVMFAPRPWSGMAARLGAFARAAEYAYEKGLIPVLFALEPKVDSPIIARLRSLITCPCIELSATGDADTILTLISRMDAVVSMRLHALIFAAGQGVPLAGVVYDPKVSGFLDYMGQNNYVNLDQLTEEALLSLLDRALSCEGSDPSAAAHLRELAQKNADYARLALED